MPVHIRSFLTQLLALITLLMLSSVPAYAEWVKLDKTDDGMTTYADPDTVRRKGDLVKMWELIDHKTIQTRKGAPFISIKSQIEHDCAEERSRSLALIMFSGHMGSGEVVFSKSSV